MRRSRLAQGNGGSVGVSPKIMVPQIGADSHLSGVVGSTFALLLPPARFPQSHKIAQRRIGPEKRFG